MKFKPGSSASCDGKKVYASYWAARRGVKSLSRHRDNARPNMYRCLNCHFWHVGNTRGKTKRNRIIRFDEREYNVGV